MWGSATLFQAIQACCHAVEKVIQTAFLSLSLTYVIQRAVSADSDEDLPSQQLEWKILLKSRKGGLKNGESGGTRRKKEKEEDKMKEWKQGAESTFLLSK